MSPVGLSYNNFIINGVERVSIPVNVSQQLRRKMLKLYSPHRVLAKIVWHIILYFPPSAHLFRLINQTNGPSSRLGNFDWIKWMVRIKTLLGEKDLVPAFYFPPQLDRRKCSVLVFTEENTPVAYAKISWGDEEIKQTKNESEAYLFINHNHYNTFETPYILLSENFEGRYFNLLSSFPSDLKPTSNYWSNSYQIAWEELSSSTKYQLPLGKLSWWKERRSWNKTWAKSFEIVTMNEPKNGYWFCSAHGDYSLWNSRVRRDRLYLFDWEYYEKLAPLFLDPFYFFFSRELLLKKTKDNKSILKAIDTEFESISSIHPSVPDLLLALIYFRTHNQGRGLEKELDELNSILVS
jgi:hypothetical protein